MEQDRLYVKMVPQPMHPWEPGEDLTGVSISEADSPPSEGDFIATNPDNPSDRWLIKKDYHKKHYVEMNPS